MGGNHIGSSSQIFSKRASRGPQVFLFFRVPNVSSKLIEREDDARPCQTEVQRVLNGNPGRQLASSMTAVECVSVALDRS